MLRLFVSLLLAIILIADCGLLAGVIPALMDLPSLGSHTTDLLALVWIYSMSIGPIGAIGVTA